MLLYGLSLPSIAYQMGKSPEETEHFLASYFERFPRVQAWMEEVKTEAIVNGGITLWSGRWWESIPGLEYQAVNAYVQGSSADLTSFAAIRVSDYLKKSNHGTLLSLIHDEMLISLRSLDAIPHIQKLMECQDVFGISFSTDVEVKETY